MTTLDYTTAAVPVRHDLAACHGRALERLRAPGTWWSGAERVTIAAESRRAAECGLCARCRTALTPAAIGGHHESDGRLSPAAVDAIHRIATDPGRLTRRWLDGLIVEGLAVEPYVELVGVVAAVINLDVFARGVGAAPVALPAPRPGAPTRQRPEAARDHGWWVPVIDPADASGPWADLYPGPAYPHMQRSLTLVPDEARGAADLMTVQYMPYGRVPLPGDSGERALSRTQMELLAARVSALNQCFY
jgi:hypothetical protein